MLLDLAGPGEMPSFVLWVHVLPAAVKISVWLEERADTTESDYLIASQARSLINRLARDLETAGINTQPLNPAHGADYVSVFGDIINALLAGLGVVVASSQRYATQPTYLGGTTSTGEAHLPGGYHR
jgi:hypothetical protein